MANSINYAVELHGIYKTFREVMADDKLKPEHKLWMLKDLIKSIPARVMCGACLDTYDIITSIMKNHVEDLLSAAVPAKVAAVIPATPKATQTQAKKPKAKARTRKK